MHLSYLPPRRFAFCDTGLFIEMKKSDEENFVGSIFICSAYADAFYSYRLGGNNAHEFRIGERRKHVFVLVADKA
jgi:hypothetical protein